jgi:hypothetical protein
LSEELVGDGRISPFDAQRSQHEKSNHLRD